MPLNGKSVFLQKLKNWEYWPSWVTNIPVVGFWLFQAAKTGKLFFFSTVNPAAKNGGLLGNSKMKILESIPVHYLPKSAMFKYSPDRKENVLQYLSRNNICYPVIVKPDIGERGLNVHRIDHQSELETHLLKAEYDLIIQEYVDYPMEVTILCYQIPGTHEAGITSVCMKEFLKVTGDGQTSIHELIMADKRARLYEEVLSRKWNQNWKNVPADGEDIWLQPIGNHCKGTKFINANHQIDQSLIDTFTGILKQMEGFNYGRFDLKCKSWESLKQGMDFKILEFNGVNSEPAHIYDPEYRTIDRYRDFYKQWELMARIHKVQASRGIKPLNFREALKEGKQYIRYLKAVKTS